MYKDIICNIVKLTKHGLKGQFFQITLYFIHTLQIHLIINIYLNFTLTKTTSVHKFWFLYIKKLQRIYVQNIEKNIIQ